MATTKKRNSSAASSDLHRPLDPAIAKKADQIAATYRIIISHDAEDGWCGECVELPLIVGFGRDPNSCVRETRENIAAALALMLEDGDEIPAATPERRAR